MAQLSNDWKEWAREHLRGVENLTMPSFTPDLSALDEPGIRWDVRQAKAHGFVSTLCAAEQHLTIAEAKRFVEIAVDEARSDLLVSTTLFRDSLHENAELLAHAARVGAHTALLGYPASFRPESEDEIYDVTRGLCESADIGIVLYATSNVAFERFHPAGFPPILLEKIAALPNVVGVKIGSGDPMFISECFARCAEQALVNVTMSDWAAITVLKMGQQWIGASCYEMLQSPQKPYVVDMFNLLLAGDYQRAVDIYWRTQPLYGLFGQHIMGIMQGFYPWAMFKYYQWCVGGNGGLPRSAGRMFAHQMMGAKMAYRMAGIDPREPDAEFFAGRVNFHGQAAPRDATARGALGMPAGAMGPAGPFERQGGEQ